MHGAVMNCCALVELDDLGHTAVADYPADLFGVLFDAADDRYDTDAGEVPILATSHIIFTEARNPNGVGMGGRPPGYGENFRRWIRANGLGRVKKFRPKQSPRTGNMITLYVWTLNVRAVNRWARKYVRERGR